MKNTLILLFTFVLCYSSLAQDRSDAIVTYLGHSGWSVEFNNNLLIFDYQERFDFDWGDQKPEKNMASGYITSEEIKNYKVYVFVSHSHIDHFDKVIFEWEKELEDITYIFGWDYEEGENHICLKAPRGTYSDDNIIIHTVNSHHSGVPESAFLVTIDGLTIYHNGDCKSEYEKDFVYLRTKAEKIDLAFCNADNSKGTPHYFMQSLTLIESFNVIHFFPMHCINKEAEYQVFGDKLTEYGSEAENHIAKVKGEQFFINSNNRH